MHADVIKKLYGSDVNARMVEVADTVLAISMDKKQKPIHPAWFRKEKQIIGKRKFEIYVREI